MSVAACLACSYIGDIIVVACKYTELFTSRIIKTIKFLHSIIKKLFHVENDNHTIQKMLVSARHHPGWQNPKRVSPPLRVCGYETLSVWVGKLTISRRYNLLPLLRSSPGGFTRSWPYRTYPCYVIDETMNIEQLMAGANLQYSFFHGAKVMLFCE